MPILYYKLLIFASLFAKNIQKMFLGLQKITISVFYPYVVTNRKNCCIIYSVYLSIFERIYFIIWLRITKSSLNK